MTYPVMPMNLGNTKAPTMFESLMGFGKTALNPGDGTAPVNVAAVPGFGSFDNTNGLGSGAYGMDPIPGVMGGPSVNPIDAFTGQNNTGYTPLTQLGAGNFGSVGGDSIVDQMGTSKFWFGGKGPDGSSTVGALPVGLGAVQGLGSLFLGMQQYGLAKKQLAEGQRRYDQDYAANKTLTNSRMEDRQKARVAANPNAYESVGSYMSKNGVK